MVIFGYKLIKESHLAEKETRIADLERCERILNERIKDTGVSTFEDLLELKKLLIKEVDNVEFRLRTINGIYKNLKG